MAATLWEATPCICLPSSSSPSSQVSQVLVLLSSRSSPFIPALKKKKPFVRSPPSCCFPHLLFDRRLPGTHPLGMALYQRHNYQVSLASVCQWSCRNQLSGHVFSKDLTHSVFVFSLAVQCTTTTSHHHPINRLCFQPIWSDLCL